jgi:SAM-dependent methyltransferase
LSLTQYETLFQAVNDYLINKEATILDWGCGNGWFSYYLISLGCRNVTSYGYGWDDINPAREAIPLLHVVNGAEQNLKNPSHLPFPNGTYDFVFSIGVLEHVHETDGDQIASLMEINRVLKQNGIFYCYHFPNKYTWIEFLKRIVIPAKRRAYLHTKKFTKSDIREMAIKSGFELLNVKRYNFLPYNLFRENKLDNKWVSSIYNFVDRAICLTPLNIFCQCYFFVARKKN